MQKMIDLAVLVVVVATVGSMAVAAQQAAQLHDSQYPDVDIAQGAQLYAAQCAACHGASARRRRGEPAKRQDQERRHRPATPHGLITTGFP